jgi:CBS domain-containing protein
VDRPPDETTTVADVMHQGVVTCSPDATLRTVAGILARNQIHAVVVAAEHETAARAVVTDRDVVFSHSRGELDRVTAGEAATVPTVTVRPDADLRHASQLMAHFGTSHVLVSDRGGGAPVGIVSSLDIAKVVGDAGDDRG